MEKTFIAVRNVDAKTFNKFKVLSTEEQIKLGVALTIAMQYFINERESLQKNKNMQDFLSIKPIDFGPNTERTSEEIDEILYS